MAVFSLPLRLRSHAETHQEPAGTMVRYPVETREMEPPELERGGMEAWRLRRSPRSSPRALDLPSDASVVEAWT